MEALPEELLSSPAHADGATPLVRALRLSRFELAEWLLEWGGQDMLATPNDNPLLALVLGTVDPDDPVVLKWVDRFRSAGHAWEHPGKWDMVLQDVLDRRMGYVKDGLRKIIAATGGPRLPPSRGTSQKSLVDTRTGILRRPSARATLAPLRMRPPEERYPDKPMPPRRRTPG